MKLAFLRWQCRVRQMAMRDQQGRPDEASMPDLLLAGDTEPRGQIVTVLCKSAEYSVTPELQHIYRSIRDAAARRKEAIQFLSATHYQKPAQFAETLTASFAAQSAGARTLVDAGQCTLIFEAYGQRYVLPVGISALPERDTLYQATWWHNALFNSELRADAMILGFTPDWIDATATPTI